MTSTSKKQDALVNLFTDEDDDEEEEEDDDFRQVWNNDNTESLCRTKSEVKRVIRRLCQEAEICFKT